MLACQAKNSEEKSLKKRSQTLFKARMIVAIRRVDPFFESANAGLAAEQVGTQPQQDGE
jgi:hypothetical protein